LQESQENVSDRAIAFYLGHTTKRGTPALQTTIRYTQASRDQVRAKLKLVEG
jgi:hypothetical protein